MVNDEIFNMSVSTEREKQNANRECFKLKSSTLQTYYITQEVYSPPFPTYDPSLSKHY